MKRFLCVALVILMLPLWIVSCDKDPGATPGTELSEAEKFHSAEGRVKLVENGAPVYTVVRPEMTTGEIMSVSAMIVDAVKEKTGVEIVIASDWLDRGTSPNPAAYEILVGNTNRPESTQVSDTLAEHNFGIEIVGNKIVINAKNTVDVERAVLYFVDTYLAPLPAAEGLLSVEGNINYRSSTEYITLATAGQNNYMVTWPYSEKEYCVWTYGPGDSMEAIATTIHQKLNDNKKHALAISSDRLILDTLDPTSWKEVLVGNTTRPETTALKSTLAYNEYAIKVAGPKLVVAGLGHTATKEAAGLLGSFLDLYRDASTGSFRLPADFYYKSTYTGARNWELNIPEYKGGFVDSVSDGGDNSYVVVVKDTTKEEYDAYLTALESAGYTKYSDNVIGVNYFAIYKNDNVILNVYYTSNDTSTHIVVDKANATTLPALASENVYTDKGIKPTVTQMYINHFEKSGAANNGGQCHIFELCDGRFIVVDGGPNGKENGKDDAQNLYELLLKLSDGEKPVIAAWFVTHLHNDHVYTFQDFANRYYKDVIVEDVIYNVPPPSMCNGMTSKAISDFNKAIAKYPGVTKIKTHTGQKFYYANAEIDMILAQDLIYPNYVQFYNDTSLTFMVKMAGQNILITGDLSPNAAPILTKVYGDALQCDILQIAHHGSMGPDIAFYEKTNPTQLALLPMGKGQLQRLTTEKENVFIAKLVKIVVQCNGTKTFELPYKK